MKSSKLKVSPRRRTYTRLIGQIKRALNMALEEEKEKRGLSVTEIGQILDVDKSHISRKFAGTSNMTLETLADLAFALDRTIEVTLSEPRHETFSNIHRSTVASAGNARPQIVPVGDWANLAQASSASSLGEVAEEELV